MDIPSLFMIPSAVSSHKVHSVFPNSTDADFDFVRSSTATRVNSNGFIESVASGQARLNYEIDGGLVNTKPSLLLEPQSTNLFTESNNVGIAASTKLDNQIISPEGLQNAALYVENTATSSHGAIKSNILPTAGATTYTLSVFAKAKERHLLRLNIYANGASNLTDNFDLINGTVSDANSTIEDFGNGWFRCSTTKTVTNSGGYNFAAVYMGKTTSSYYYAGDGQSGLYLFGFQLEQQSYPTSYIPTNGSTQTRAAETCNGAGTSSILPSEEGILYAEIQGLNNGTNQRWIAIGSGGNANRVSIHFNSTNNISCSVRGTSSARYDANFNIGSQTNNTKAAIRYKDSDYSFFVNGVKVDSQQSNSLNFNASLSELAFDSADGASYFYGKIRDIRVYNTKEMTDSEVDILLTKITS